mmetsp:Transcript_93601/g.214059  ORF Transcript_93601/g.214059 Transcript_93601/m.214059 type:complete len:303 (-) Transcript_93601:38-946(-)
MRMMLPAATSEMLREVKAVSDEMQRMQGHVKRIESDLVFQQEAQLCREERAAAMAELTRQSSSIVADASPGEVKRQLEEVAHDVGKLKVLVDRHSMAINGIDRTQQNLRNVSGRVTAVETDIRSIELSVGRLEVALEDHVGQVQQLTADLLHPRSTLALISADAPMPAPPRSKLAQHGDVEQICSTAVCWRIPGVMRMDRGAGVISPEFSLSGCSGKLTCFPFGSTSSGKTSVYWRAQRGVHAKFRLGAGDVFSDELECTYDKAKEKGKHELCDLKDAVGVDGVLTVTLEIIWSNLPMSGLV